MHSRNRQGVIPAVRCYADGPLVSGAAVRRLLLLAAALLVGSVLLAQPPAVVSRPAVLAISPSYFECRHCESFLRHKQLLERQYPGLKVTQLKVDQATAQALGITAFPTIIVGEQVIGYGPAERERIHQLLGGS